MRWRRVAGIKTCVYGLRLSRKRVRMKYEKEMLFLDETSYDFGVFFPPLICLRFVCDVLFDNSRALCSRTHAHVSNSGVIVDYCCARR